MKRFILLLAFLLFTPSSGVAMAFWHGQAAAVVCSATNGQLDLSFCSNAIYIAVIF